MHETQKSFEARATWRCAAFAALLLPWLAACGPPPAQLNSERIQERFGSYGIEVLGDGSTLRRSNLYSVHDGVRVGRTYAVVRLFDLPARDSGMDLSQAHAYILGGASIGATLEEAGWRVDKVTRYVGELPELRPVPEWTRLMHLESTAGLAVHVYKLVIKKSSEVHDYADIIEVHHPEYLGLSELAALYPVTAAEEPGDTWPATLLRLLATAS